MTEGNGVDSEGRVHQLFDPATGRLMLVCEDTETFERLRAILCREAQVGVMVNIPPAPVRSVSLELAEYADPASVSWGQRLGAWGCVAVLVLAGGVFIAGLFAIIAWIRG